MQNHIAELSLLMVLMWLLGAASDVLSVGTMMGMLCSVYVYIYMYIYIYIYM